MKSALFRTIGSDGIVERDERFGVRIVVLVYKTPCRLGGTPADKFVILRKKHFSRLCILLHLRKLFGFVHIVPPFCRISALQE